jgi:hypothetical protein
LEAILPTANVCVERNGWLHATLRHLCQMMWVLLPPETNGNKADE